ncbi:hypothetical protein OU994_13380 [Pseudoduganella sp. SL102]|uniref:hypothetical protein n=1 Tax=Pseudoduganella sp. SL102 TaxID=2995154 RepID=UPI00248B5B4D|nr:hypothetical protein [Pseudoduganella sp. SL102]WBS05195.1 hypothetical protein OU994_13380 [Pseudoduganella sp. SL102]
MISIQLRRACAAAMLGPAVLAAGHAHAEEPASPLTIGGAIRFNYVHKGWQAEKPRGFVGLDTVRLEVKYDDGTRIASAQYRYNRFPEGQGGYWQHFFHHGWVGLRLADRSTVHVGLDKVPFGLLPFASNNFYESIAFYAGFEDKYDAGLTYASAPGKLEWQLAFFPRDGGSYGGGDNTAPASNRYSYNIVRDDDEHGYGTGQRDSERNTLVARVAWHADTAIKQEFGASVLGGEIRNGAGKDTRRNAIAIHYRATPGPVTVMLQAMRYRYRTSHAPTQTYGGLDANSFVMVGGFGYPYPVATKGDIYIANVSHDIPGTLGPFSGFKVYNDYSALHKRVGSYGPSRQNVAGVSFSAGKWFFYADLMMGKHHPYMSPDFGGLASTAGQHDRWARRINLQAGYYF